MMKTNWLVALALGSLFAEPSRASALRVELVGFQSPRLSAALPSRWAEWSKAYGPPAEGGAIRVRLLKSGEAPSLAGTIQSGEIQIRHIDAAEHELAHLFVHGKCPSWRHNLLLHEALALWLSRDYSRLEKKWHSYDDAIAFLKTNPANGSKFEGALARAIAQNQLRFKDFSFRSLASCGEGAQQEALAILGVAGGQEIPGEIRAMVLDGKSGRILHEEGETARRAPVGSTLKPWLIESFPKLQLALESKSWKCGREGLWAWPEALVKSCNEFFMSRDFLQDGWKEFRETANALSLPEPPRSQAALVGILPSYFLSVEEMARLYRFLSLKNSKVFPELAQVPKSGTLAGVPEAEWFLKYSVQLKTGSVRGKDSQPLESWIAAVVPAEKSAGLVAVVQASGIATRDMSRRLKEILTPFMQARERSSEVQVLGIQQDVVQNIRCTNGQFVIELGRGVRFHKSLAFLKSGSTYTCASGPLEVTHGRGSGSVRRLYGSIEISPQMRSLGAPRERARAGSPYVLRTSELEYVYGVLASEFPNGHFETLKVLAVAARENGRRGQRHGGRPVCDTTHCQVYGLGGISATSKRGARLIQAILDVESIKVPSSVEWMPFSLGGQHAWEKELSANEVTKMIGLKEIRSIEAGEILQIHGERIFSMHCEVFRNSLRLLSCPTKISNRGDKWLFSGRGEGHGMGLDLELADALAGSGAKLPELLKRFYSVELAY